MPDEFAPVLASVHKMCVQFGGGISGIVDLLLDMEGDKRRAKATLYSDLNPNPSSLGRLKARDMYLLMKIAQNFEPLRILAAMCGFSLISLSNVEPDAPTVEAEMLQDYPALVAFHETLQQYRDGKVEYVAVLNRLQVLWNEINETAAKAKREKA